MSKTGENTRSLATIPEDKTTQNQMVEKKEKGISLHKKVAYILNTNKWYKRYPKTTIFTVIGLVVAICFIALGFWETVLIALLTGIGFTYGQYKDQALWVYKLIKKLLR